MKNHLRNHSLRNLIIGYSIAVVVVLLTIWIAFSTLRSQERELATISKTREVLQKIQPVFVDLTEFESQLGTILIFNKGNSTAAYIQALNKIKSDSALMMQLSASHPENRDDYRQLANLLHNMTAFAAYVLSSHKENMFNEPTNTWHTNSGKEIITEFKATADKLEDISRKTLSISYSNTINLTRKTFDFVKIIAAILILILFITFLLIYRDIRDREKKQETLSKFNEKLEKKVDEKTKEIRESEKKYRAVIEQASDAIMVTDQKGDFVDANTALCKKFDYTKEELLGSNISKLIDPEQLRTDPIRFDLLQSGQTILRERRMLHKSGAIIEVEANVKMLPDGRIMAIARDITERKKAAETIMRERDLSDSIINSLPGIFYLINQHGVYLRWNRNLETILGYTGEEIRNLPPYYFIAPEDKEPLQDKIERVFKLEDYNTMEATLIKKDGTRVSFFLTGIPVKYEGQSCLLGTGIDITSLKQAQKELITSEETRRLIMNSSLDAIICIDVAGVITMWTPQAEKVFGWKEQDVLGKHLANIIIPTQYRAMHRKGIEGYVKSGRSAILNRLIEITALNSKGEEFPVELAIVPYEQGGQTFFCGFIRDITERKKAEEALKKSEANLKTIFETTDDGYALMDENFGIISYNQRGFDFVINELRAKPGPSNNLIDFLPPDRKSFLRNLKEKVFETGHVNYEISYKQPDDSYKWYYIRMFTVNNNEKKILGLMMAVTDITEKKLMEQEILNRKVQEQKNVTRAILNAEERERNKIGQELHDNVNQILASIKLYLSMAKGKEGEEFTETIKESSQLLDNAIEEIRSLSKSQVTPLKKIDLKELIQALMDKLDEASDVATKFVYLVNGKLIADDLKLNIYRIVQEQINNILKHAEASVISVALYADDTHLNISVADNGKGFVPDQKRRGIGVSNMINRVESFNGELDIISSPGNGCEIQIRIPC